MKSFLEASWNHWELRLPSIALNSISYLLGHLRHADQHAELRYRAGNAHAFSSFSFLFHFLLTSAKGISACVSACVFVLSALRQRAPPPLFFFCFC